MHASLFADPWLKVTVTNQSLTVSNPDMSVSHQDTVPTQLRNEISPLWTGPLLKLYSAESASNIMYSSEKQLLVAVQNHPCKFQLHTPEGETFSRLVFSLEFQGKEIPLEFSQNESCSCSNGVRDFLSASFEKVPSEKTGNYSFIKICPL